MTFTYERIRIRKLSSSVRRACCYSFVTVNALVFLSRELLLIRFYCCVWYDLYVLLLVCVTK